jgi:hypothetical protein
MLESSVLCFVPFERSTCLFIFFVAQSAFSAPLLFERVSFALGLQATALQLNLRLEFAPCGFVVCITMRVVGHTGRN